MNRRQFLAGLGSAVALGVFGDRFSAVAGNTARKPGSGPFHIDSSAFHAMRKFLDLRQGKIAYVERGEGPVALFMHGYPLNGYHWRGALERLAAHRRCVVPDFLGLGYTEAHAEQDLSPQAQTDMLVDFLDALRIDSVDVIANDSGGTIAQLLAVQHPGRVRSLLLTNCDVHEDSPPPALRPFMNLAATGKAAKEFLRPQYEDGELARSPAGLGGLTYTDPANLSDESIEVYFAPLLSSPLRERQFERYAVQFDPNPLIAIEPDLKRLPTPARMIWGTGDHLFDISWAHWLDRTLPASRGVRVVEGAKLFFTEEMPDLFAEEALAFWRLL